jgi:hypothetical protein
MSVRALAAPVLWAVAILLTGVGPFLIAIAPLVLLLALLFCGRYPGEAAMVRLRIAIRRLRVDPGPRAHRSSLFEPRGWRGGQLISASSGGRAPPACW